MDVFQTGGFQTRVLFGTLVRKNQLYKKKQIQYEKRNFSKLPTNFLEKNIKLSENVHYWEKKHFYGRRRRWPTSRGNETKASYNTHSHKVHCPKNNLNLWHTNRGCHSQSRCNIRCLAFVYTYLAQKSDIFSCICSNHDRLLFYAEF